jgi:hypothetical protein
LIRRRPLVLESRLYSREHDVDRSTGCHLMEVVNYMDKAMGNSRYTAALSERTMEALAACGFTWEHVCARTDQLEDALSLEAMRMEFVQRPELLFPGEMFWCQQCDDVMDGGDYARDHCLTRSGSGYDRMGKPKGLHSRRLGAKLDRRHNGIYFTPDAVNVDRSRVAEFKFTWVSSSRTGPDHMDGIWKWPVQNMSYTWGMGGWPAGYKGGELRAVFVVGDFKQGTYEPFPESYEFDLDYEQRELEMNWSMVVANGRAMGLL